MPTRVSSMVNIDGPEIPVTRDLLGEFSKARNVNSKKKDHLEEKINIVNPLGPTTNWDSLHHHHDLKPGKLQAQRMSRRRSHAPDSPLSSSSTSTNNNNQKFIQNSHTNPILKPLLQDEESCRLDLKLNLFKSELVDPTITMMSRSFDAKTSVICTLDKVKFALERAKKRSPSDEDESQEERRAIVSKKGGVMFAAGCPGCLFYVIASRDDPKCPSCNYYFGPCDNVVAKKPRIGLD